MDKTVNSRKFLIATHGTLASGIKSSLDIIIGATENLFLMQAYVEENKSLEEEIVPFVKELGDDEELIVFSDLLGGSVTNQILQYGLRDKVHIVAGFNLGLVMEILLSDIETPVEQVIAEAIINAKEQMVYVNKLLTTQNTNND
ncbi:PTS sugar transporter subunit IIA [Pedobacter miscanthi]|uniref:PTS fructose transporter subunit IIA n=1 Tax=Pedobacter miscanthi TaxID=2259170 RepID=A0A366KN44_9SPHI|nr:PTS fructose transporter subunit IIA [Pedobacter miscanthi]RBQ03101.1 PTS fructose transporter subunit IIA [Pedobacter miscanthi]